MPPAASTPVLRSILLAVGVDAGDVEDWLAALRRVRGSERRQPSQPRGSAPYRGLASFEPDDAELFFGREGPTTEILDRIARLARDAGPSAGLLAVVGPSGAGKSSVLRAGVVAAVRRGELDGPDGAWTCSFGTPNALPAAPSGDGPHLVVIDQFEETFTSADADRRAEVLSTIAARRDGQVVVLGMRADFYADAARVPALLVALQHDQVLIGPMRPDDLRDAIRLPAERSGMDIEDGLVELVLADLEPRAGRQHGAHDVGTLPLMSHALLAAWDRSDGHRLTIADYRATGGIDGAVQQTAEDAFSGLPPEQQQMARSVFLRLVNVEGDVMTTRRRIAAAELETLGAHGTAAQLATRFVSHRLLTAGDGWYEISHEALLSAWPRLRDWVDEDRAGLVTHRQLTDAANAWGQTDRDDGALLRGARLAVSETWAREHGSDLNQLEAAFLAASQSARSTAQHFERRRLQRLRGLVAVSAVLVVVAVVLSFVFVQARDRADRATAQEGRVRNAAESRAMAFQAAELRETNPALAQQLALAAYRAEHTGQARGELIDESSQPVITRVLGQSGPTALDATSSRGLIAVSHAVDGTVHLYSTRDGAVPRPVGVVPGVVGKQVFAMAFDPAGTLLATGGENNAVELWDVGDPAHPSLAATVHPSGFGGAIEALAISPDGHTLAAGSDGSERVMRWDITDPSHPRGLAALPGIAATADSPLTTKALAFDRTGRTLAASDSSGAVELWTLGGRRVPDPRTLRTGTSGVFALAFDPVSPLLFTAGAAGVVDVWPTTHPSTKPVHVLSGRTASQINALAVSADGRTLAAGSSDNDLRQWNVPDFEVRSDTGNPGPVTGIVFLPGDRIAYTAADGTLRLQGLGGPRLPASGPVFALGWSAGGRRLLVGSSGTHGGEQLWDASDPGDPVRLGPLLRMPGPYEPIAGTGAMTPDGDLVAGGNAQGRVELWDTSDPQHPRATTKPFVGDGALVESLAFTPDGHTLVVGGDDGDVHLWDVRDPARPRELATVSEGNLVLNVAVSSDGRYLAAANADDSAYLYRITDPSHPVRLARITATHNYVWGVAFSPNGRTLATADADETTRLFDIADPTRPHQLGRPLIGPSDYVYSADFSPHGRTVAVASNDGTVRIYRADGRGRVPNETLRRGGSNLFTAAYSPNGRVLAGGGRSDSVTLWSTDVESYAAGLCRTAGDPITRAEWALDVPGEPYDPPCR